MSNTAACSRSAPWSNRRAQGRRCIDARVALELVQRHHLAQGLGP